MGEVGCYRRLRTGIRPFVLMRCHYESGGRLMIERYYLCLGSALLRSSILGVGDYEGWI